MITFWYSSPGLGHHYYPESQRVSPRLTDMRGHREVLQHHLLQLLLYKQRSSVSCLESTHPQVLNPNDLKPFRINTYAKTEGRGLASPPTFQPIFTPKVIPRYDLGLTCGSLRRVSPLMSQATPNARSEVVSKKKVVPTFPNKYSRWKQ